MNKWSFTYIGITILATISLLSCRDRMVDKEMQMVIERGDKNWSFPFASDDYPPYYRKSNFFNLANKYLYMWEFVDK